MVPPELLTRILRAANDLQTAVKTELVFARILPSPFFTSLSPDHIPESSWTILHRRLQKLPITAFPCSAAGSTELKLPCIDSKYMETGSGKASTSDLAATLDPITAAWLARYRPNIVLNRFVTAVAALGRLSILMAMHPGLNFLQGFGASTMDVAAGEGRLEVVKFLHHRRSEGCTVTAMNNAAGEGHLDVVRFLKENRTEGCTEEAVIRATAGGHIEVVKYLVENDMTYGLESAIDEALKAQQTTVLEYLVDEVGEKEFLDLYLAGYNRDVRTIFATANLPLLQFLHRHYPDHEAWRDAECCTDIAQSGLVEELRFFLTQVAEAPSSGAAKLLLPVTILDIIAARGHAEMFRFIHSLGLHKVTSETVRHAVSSGDVELLRYLHRFSLSGTSGADPHLSGLETLFDDTLVDLAVTECRPAALSFLIREVGLRLPNLEATWINSGAHTHKKVQAKDLLPMLLLLGEDFKLEIPARRQISLLRAMTMTLHLVEDDDSLRDDDNNGDTEISSIVHNRSILELLQAFHRLTGVDFWRADYLGLITDAASNGHFAALEYLYAKLDGQPSEAYETSFPPGNLKRCSIECFRLLIERRNPALQRFADCAAADGRLDLLKCLRSFHAMDTIAPLPWCSSKALVSAARNGHVEVVRYFLEDPIDDDWRNAMGLTASTLESAIVAGTAESHGSEHTPAVAAFLTACATGKVAVARLLFAHAKKTGWAANIKGRIETWHPISMGMLQFLHQAEVLEKPGGDPVPSGVYHASGTVSGQRSVKLNLKLLIDYMNLDTLRYGHSMEVLTDPSWIPYNLPSTQPVSYIYLHVALQSADLDALRFLASLTGATAGEPHSPPLMSRLRFRRGLVTDAAESGHVALLTWMLERLEEAEDMVFWGPVLKVRVDVQEPGVQDCRLSDVCLADALKVARAKQSKQPTSAEPTEYYRDKSAVVTIRAVDGRGWRLKGSNFNDHVLTFIRLAVQLKHSLVRFVFTNKYEAVIRRLPQDGASPVPASEPTVPTEILVADDMADTFVPEQTSNLTFPTEHIEYHRNPRSIITIKSLRNQDCELDAVTFNAGILPLIRLAVQINHNKLVLEVLDTYGAIVDKVPPLWGQQSLPSPPKGP
ncbi:hypothetical protein HDU96_008044 [Phlyctochytrium bullatum]|nr:hypothetical protein HDU96_008044 [Phlyctochytrium bullatum]